MSFFWLSPEYHYGLTDFHIFTGCVFIELFLAPVIRLFSPEPNPAQIKFNLKQRFKTSVVPNITFTYSKYNLHIFWKEEALLSKRTVAR